MPFKAHLVRIVRSGALIPLSLFTVFILALLLSIYTTAVNYMQLTVEAFERHTSLVRTAALVLEGRFDRIVDIGNALSSRVRFRDLIQEGKWNEARDILKDIPAQFPFIDRIILTDLSGVLMADVPERPAVRGINFSYRDWYQGVSKEWKPYVSDIYIRTAEPQIRVVATAVPIRGDDEELLGILVIQVKLEEFVAWAQIVEAEPDSNLYFIDKRGNVASSGLEAAQEIVNRADELPIQRLLQKESGADLFFDKTESRLVAYHPLSRYDWGAVIEESESTAFTERNQTLWRTMVTQAFFLIITAGLLLIVWSFERKIRRHARELERQVAVRTKLLEEKIIRLDRLTKVMVGRELRMIQLKKELEKKQS